MLIGIHGKAKAGKDTMAGILRSNHGFGQMSFAGPLKMVVSWLYGWNPDLTQTEEGKNHYSEYWGTTVRAALQRVGTEVIRGSLGDDFWVRRWLWDYEQVKEEKHIVLSDVRFENEATAIRQMGGLIVHIRRKQAGLAGEQGMHASERGIEVHRDDIEIENDGTIAELAYKTRGIVEFLTMHHQIQASRH